MEPYSVSPVSDPLQQPWMQPVLLGATILMVVIALILGGLVFLGYGSAHIIGIPANATVSLNGHTLSTNSVKLRPGTYELTVTSPLINPYEGTIHVGLFQTTTAKPSLQARDVNAIASSLIGAIPGTATPPDVANPHWFENNTWVAGTLAPTDTVIVMHYDSSKGQWSVALSNNPGYPDNPASLPSDVAAYIQPLLAGGV